LLQTAAEALLPKDSLPGAERDARRQVETDYRDFFALLERAYNLIVRFNVHFHDRPLRSLSVRECAALLLFGRIANGLRRTQEDALHGYGPDACGHAASLFEFCWTVAYLSGDEAAAAAWLAREQLSEGMDVRRAINAYLTRRSVAAQQFETEYEVYRRLNAFKHASPVWLSFHRPQDWEELGTLRMGPDLSQHGQWALCFALEVGSQLVLLALIEAANQLLPSPGRERYMQAVDAANQECLRLHAILQGRWGQPKAPAGP
jgi:hypothetical protein